jgi:hypothetical protein
MEQIVLTAGSASDLNQKVKDMIEQGWTPVGSHKVVEKHHQLRYSGMQHKDTQIQSEYSQTVKKV